MSIQGVSGSCRVSTDDQPSAVRGTSTPPELLPAPDEMFAAPADDVLVALAIAMVKQKHDERVVADRTMAAGNKAQEAAHARKIEKMRELADDTLMEGIVGGVLDGASAIASGASAVTKFSGEMKGISADDLSGDARTKDFAPRLAKESKELARNAGILDATSRGLHATAGLAGASCKSAQEDDRKEIAEADAAKDAAKATIDGGASTVNRANEDIRATIAALRQLVAAKSQLANAAILRG